MSLAPCQHRLMTRPKQAEENRQNDVLEQENHRTDGARDAAIAFDGLEVVAGRHGGRGRASPALGFFPHRETRQDGKRAS